MPQEAEPFFTYHVEHIIARRHGGGDNSENLAFACYHCNLHKGPNLSGIDQESGALVRLFNPREDTMPSDPRFRSVRRLDYDGGGDLNMCRRGVIIRNYDASICRKYEISKQDSARENERTSRRRRSSSPSSVR